jgi:hypothetical protein
MGARQRRPQLTRTPLFASAAPDRPTGRGSDDPSAAFPCRLDAGDRKVGSGLGVLRGQLRFRAGRHCSVGRRRDGRGRGGLAHAVDASAAEYERYGYVLNLRTFHPEVKAIGVPIVGAGGRGVMALNCGGASTVMTRKLLGGPVAEALKRLAETLSGLLALEPSLSRE